MKQPITAENERGLMVPEVAPAMLTPKSIELIKRNIKLVEQMVMEIMEEGVDYGTLPGTPGPGLWDPGASTIINHFNCYPEHKILKAEETDSLISYIIETQLVSRDSRQIVATGLGASSTRETKHKYRWVLDPGEYGYEKQGLKTKTDDGKTKYRIPNPEYGELVNTIVKMAAKRSEVDAAQCLPGVARALRKLFGKKLPQKGEEWKHFWGKVRQIGLTQDEAHSILGVKSMKDWLDQGKTIEDAIEILMRQPAKRETVGGEAKVIPEAKRESPKEIKEKEEQVTSPLAKETAPAPADNRLILWGNIRGLFGRLKPRLRDDLITKWFVDHYLIEVKPEMFNQDQPPEELTERILDHFHNSLLAYEATLKTKG
jgi:hypothetical protein